MSLADGLRAIVFHTRAIPGALGLRRYAVAIVHRSWSGANTGDGVPTINVTPLVEGSGRPPKVRFVNSEERTVRDLPSGAVMIGPITPDFPGGGTLLSSIRAWQNRGDEVYVRLTGPRFPDGVEYHFAGFETEKALHYTITAHP